MQGYCGAGCTYCDVFPLFRTDEPLQREGALFLAAGMWPSCCASTHVSDQNFVYNEIDYFLDNLILLFPSIINMKNIRGDLTDVLAIT